MNCLCIDMPLIFGLTKYQKYLNVDAFAVALAMPCVISALTSKYDSVREARMTS